MIEYKKIQKSMARKQAISDSGIACLHSIVQYYGFNYSVGQLTAWSGASQEGATLLDIIKAAKESKLDADGYEADMQSLRECKDICILHVLLKQRFNHFLIYWGYDEALEKYIIGDPSSGTIEKYSELALDTIWESKFLVLTKPMEIAPLHDKKGNYTYWDWLLGYYKNNVKWLVAILTISTLVAILGVSFTIFLKKLVDQTISSTSYAHLLGSGLILSIILIFRSVFGYIRQLLSLHQVKKFSIQMTDIFISRILSLPKSFFDNQRTGDILGKLDEALRIQSTLSKIVIYIIPDIMWIIAAIVTIFFYQWQVGVLSILWLVASGFITKKLHNRSIKGQRFRFNSYTKLKNMFIDIMKGVNTFKSYNKQKLFNKLITRFFEEYQGTFLFVGKTAIRSAFWLEISGMLFLCGTLFIVSSSVFHTSITIGTFFLVIYLVITLVEAIFRLNIANNQVHESWLSFNRIQEVMSFLPEYNLRFDQQLAEVINFESVEVDNLSFSYTGQKFLLNQVSLTVHKRELVVVVGATNSGKSTLLKILRGECKFDSGEVRINGLDKNRVSTLSWNNCIGVVEQDVDILTGSVVDNIVLGDELDDPDLLFQFLIDYGFDTYFDELPQNINTLVGNGGVSLSKGQKQMIGIARALWKKPQLLLLDETLSVLDCQTQRFVFDLLTRIKVQMGILLLTNKGNSIDNADRVYQWN